MPAEPADVFLNQIDPRRRHMQRRILGEAQREIFLAPALLGERLHARELGDPMRHVNDVIADLQIKERIDGTRSNDFADSSSLLVSVEKLVVTEESDWLLVRVPDEASMKITHRNIDLLAESGSILLDQ